MTTNTLTVPMLSIASRKLKQLFDLGYCKATALNDTTVFMLQSGFTKEEATAATTEAHTLLKV